jgi:hypothetical protein
MLLKNSGNNVMSVGFNHQQVEHIRRPIIPSMRRPVSVKGVFSFLTSVFMAAPFCTYSNIAADLSPSFHPHS